MTLSVSRLWSVINECGAIGAENHSPNAISHDLGSNPGHSGRQPCISDIRYLRVGGTYWLCLQGEASSFILTVILNLPSYVFKYTHYIVLAGLMLEIITNLFVCLFSVPTNKDIYIYIYIFTVVGTPGANKMRRATHLAHDSSLLKEFHILGYNAMQSVESQPTFRKNMPPTYPRSKNWAKSREMFSSETSADFKRTTRRYFPEDRSLHNHRCEYFIFGRVIFSLK
jgi:hypothetical protein